MYPQSSTVGVASKCGDLLLYIIKDVYCKGRKAFPPVPLGSLAGVRIKLLSERLTGHKQKLITCVPPVYMGETQEK